MTVNQVAVIMAAIEEAERCPNYCADASAGEHPCDGLDGCHRCLELAAIEVLAVLDGKEL